MRTDWLFPESKARADFSKDDPTFPKDSHESRSDQAKAAGILLIRTPSERKSATRDSCIFHNFFSAF
jgi:hypothetical protein